MNNYINLVNVIDNELIDISSFNTLQACLLSIYAVDKSDIHLKKIIHYLLNEEDLITDYNSIFFNQIPTKIKEGLNRRRTFENKISFLNVINLVALPKEMAADAIINFCMRKAKDKEALRYLYDQVRAKYDIAYHSIV